VKHTINEAVVEFLRFSRTTGRPTFELGGFRPAQWERCLQWMDDSGLALYFLDALEHGTDSAPQFVVERLRRKQFSNRRRTCYMESQFALINGRFETAKVKYAAVKGLTLVPQFCPDASLRHQSDFDYLVDESSLPLAQQVLEDMGYVLYKEFDHELILTLPSEKGPARGDEQYEVYSPHSVELHLAIGEFRGLAWEEPPFLENTIVRGFGRSAFRCLADDDAFLLHSIHAFDHILFGWMKLSWLYEAGYFLDTRRTDADLWQSLSRKLEHAPLLREAVAVVVSLAAQFFRAPLPSATNRWVEEIRPAVRVWIEKYSRPWAFGHNLVDECAMFPTSKLVLFLHQQYVTDSKAWRKIELKRLLALRGVNRIKRAIEKKLSADSRPKPRVRARVFRRVVYHLGAGLRYLWEVPRWRRLTRAYDRPGAAASSAAGVR